jgi:thioredoxin 1
MGDTNTAAAANTKALPRMVDFGCGDRCLPCKMMIPILDSLMQSCTGKVEIVSIDTRDNPREAAKHRIGVLPTQVFFAADGTEVYRHVGFYPKADILKKWKELGVDVGPAAASATRRTK